MGLRNGGLCGRGQVRSGGRHYGCTGQLEGEDELYFRGNEKPLKTFT